VALAGLALAGLVALAGAPADEAKDEAPAKLPADLARLPGGGVVLMSWRVADAWESKIGRGAQAKLGKHAAELTREVEKGVGVGPAQIERLTLFVADPKREPIFAVHTVRAYDRAKVLDANAPGGVEETHKGYKLYVAGGGKALCPVSERAFLKGPAEALRAALDDGPAAKGDALGGALAAAAGKHAMVVGVAPNQLARLVGRLPKELTAFKPLLEARAGLLTVDLGDKLEGDLRVSFAGAAEAKAGGKTLEAVLTLAGNYLDAGARELGLDKEMAGVVGLVREFNAALKNASVKQDGAVVRAKLEMKLDQATVGGTAMAAIQKIRVAAARTQDANNLKQIGLALHNYHDANGAFPPAAVYDKDGKALLSWRVLILPYVDQDALYKEFRLNEAWDSPHNKKLLAKMPKVYAAPAANARRDSTFYQALVGPGAAFEGKRGIRITDFIDGTSNTWLVAEAAKAVPWTKPEELAYDPGKPVPKLGGVFGGPFNVLYCDGSVRYMLKPPKETTLRALITRNGGEIIPNDD
jgi:prepilin-type processing-associated H-X9-DG protein